MDQRSSLYADLVIDIPQCANDMSKPSKLEGCHEMDTLACETLVLDASSSTCRKIGEKWFTITNVYIQQTRYREVIILLQHKSAP